MYNQRIEIFETQNGPKESKEIVTIILSDGDWPAGNPVTEEGYTDYNHLDLYKKDVPALIEKLQRIMEG
jgi:hypothetical protein